MRFNQEKNRVEITGTLTKMSYGKIVTERNGKKYESDKSYYQFSILTEEDAAVSRAVLDNYYAKTDLQYIPKWVAGTADKKDGRIYCNFKSLFDVMIFDGDTRYGFSDFLEMCGGVAPLGSDVTFSITCKDGALYISAIRIDKLRRASVEDYFS